MLVLIRNHGCDDVTTGLAEFNTQEELENFIKIIINLNDNSTYGCMPTIELYEISYDNIRLLTTEEEKRMEEDEYEHNLLYLNNKAYTFSLNEPDSVYKLTREDNDLIDKYLQKDF